MKLLHRPIVALSAFVIILAAGCGGGGGGRESDAPQTRSLTFSTFDVTNARLSTMSGKIDDYTVDPGTGNLTVTLSDKGRSSADVRKVTIVLDPDTRNSDGYVSVNGGGNTVLYEDATTASNNKIWNGTGGTIRVVKLTESKVSLELVDVVLLGTRLGDEQATGQLDLDGEASN